MGQRQLPRLIVPQAAVADMHPEIAALARVVKKRLLPWLSQRHRGRRTCLIASETCQLPIPSKKIGRPTRAEGSQTMGRQVPTEGLLTTGRLGANAAVLEDTRNPIVNQSSQPHHLWTGFGA